MVAFVVIMLALHLGISAGNDLKEIINLLVFNQLYEYKFHNGRYVFLPL